MEIHLIGHKCRWGDCKAGPTWLVIKTKGDELVWACEEHLSVVAEMTYV